LRQARHFFSKCGVLDLAVVLQHRQVTGRPTAVASLRQVMGSAAGGVLVDVVIVGGASFVLTAGFVVLAGLIDREFGLPQFLVMPQRTDTETA
jgi:hypothetical protein